MRKAGFKGALYPVNPNRPEVQGLRAYPSVAELPETPDVELIPWPYAQPRPGHPFFARTGTVYLCGDAFGRPRVQTAWLSGRAVAALGLSCCTMVCWRITPSFPPRPRLGSVRRRATRPARRG